MTDRESALDPYADALLRLPAVPEEISALVSCVPVQLYAFHVATAKFDAATLAPMQADEPEGHPS